MSGLDLNTVWFVLVGVLLTGYAVLDGFDLGTGPLLFATRDDRERRLMLNAIGPVWDGNEVWLVTGGGALFAAFPTVYATVFSGFYDAFMLLLAALIVRAVAIELRSQRSGRAWRAGWDAAFAASSLLSALLVGVALGNVVYGIPLDANHEFRGDLFTLLHPYALFVGLTAVALLVMHANLYLILKTDGALRERLARLTRLTVPAYLAAFVGLNAWTLLACPHVATALGRRPLALAGLFVTAVLLAVAIPRAVRRGREGRAFVASCLSIVVSMLLAGAAIYPALVFSTPEPANTLTIYNGAATPASLRFMALVALLGVPLVLAYTATVYWVFRGRVTLSDESY